MLEGKDNKKIQFIYFVAKNVYLCTDSLTYPGRSGDHYNAVNDDILDTGVFCNALVLTFQESRKFKEQSVEDKAAESAPMDVLYPLLKPFMVLSELIYSSTWGFRRCSFLTD